MKKYAVVNSENVVVNMVLWDEASQWSPPDEHIAVKAEDVACGIGWTHNDGAFVQPEEPLQTPDQ
jgi:hypothetical protein